MSNTPISKMNSAIPHSLDDTVFFYATKVENAGDSTWSVDVNQTDCLVNMAANTDGLPSVNELRKDRVLKKAENGRVVYEGKILFSSGIILTVNSKILMLFRDDKAPVEPLKWTCPAGRCDKEPFLTALKEFYEEVILFDGVTGQPVFVNFPEHHYFEQAQEIYRLTLAGKGFMQPIEEWIFIDADFERNSSSLLRLVRTYFTAGEISRDGTHEVYADRFFPFMDEENNTLELRLLASVSIPDKTEAQLTFCDGEYERTVKLFTNEDFIRMEDSSLVGTMLYYQRAVGS